MNKNQLDRYQKRLLALQERLVREVNAAEEDLHEDITGTGDPSNAPSHPADRDAEGMDVDIAIAGNEEQILEQVGTALDRIADGTFGTCTDCGGPIAKERLEALPFAATCIGCAKQEEAPSAQRE